ncbi:MAG: hypothetical protein WBF90_33570 [Rivularia sp. (in: cyanobacteria)]
MTILSQNAFTQGLDLLELTYGNDLSVFQNNTIFQVWFDYFKQKYSDEKFLQIIKKYISEAHFPPRVPADICKFWVDSGEERPPGENYTALPSTQINADRLTPQEMEENYLRMRLILRLTMGKAARIGKENKDKLIAQMQKMSINELDVFVQKYELPTSEVLDF